MKRGIIWRALLIVFTVLLSVVFFLPNLGVFGSMPEWWKKTMPNKGIVLGLDLQGGMHLILEVEVDKAVENRMERSVEEIRDSMRKAGIEYQNLAREKNTQVSVRLSDQKSIEAFEDMLNKEFPWLALISKTPDNGGLAIRLDLPEKEVAYIKEMWS